MSKKRLHVSHFKYFSMDGVLARMNKGALEKFEEQHPHHVSRFDGYTIYKYPDIDLGEDSIYGKCKNEFPTMNYGLAYVTIEGEEHRHDDSNAFNKLLQGRGVFLGENTDNHETPLQPGSEIYIPKYMLHGHKVI